jgi:hypothetical protein
MATAATYPIFERKGKSNINQKPPLYRALWKQGEIHNAVLSLVIPIAGFISLAAFEFMGYCISFYQFPSRENIR